MIKSIRRNLFLQPLAAVYLLGFLKDLPEGNGLPVQLDFLHPGSPPVGQHEPTPNRVKSSLLGLPR